MKRTASVFLLSAITGCLMMFLTGCKSIYQPRTVQTQPQPETSVHEKEDESKEVYYMIGMHIVLPYWQDHRKGLEAAATELGVRAIFTGESGNDALRQADIFNQAVQEKPSGIIVSPIDPDIMKEPINRAIALGIPVVCVDSDSPESNRLTYIGTDNYGSGSIAAQIVGEKIHGEGAVGVLSVPGIYSMDQRQKGFEDYMKEHYPQVRLAAVKNDEADPSRAVNMFSEMLEENPDLNGLFCTNAAGGVGAAIAAEEAGRSGEIAMVAFDKDSDVLELVEKEQIEATLVQRTFTMSYYALKFLYDYNHRHIQLTDGLIDENPLPVTVNTGVIVVDQNNISSFR